MFRGGCSRQCRRSTGHSIAPHCRDRECVARSSVCAAVWPCRAGSSRSPACTPRRAYNAGPTPGRPRRAGCTPHWCIPRQACSAGARAGRARCGERIPLRYMPRWADSTRMASRVSPASSSQRCHRGRPKCPASRRCRRSTTCHAGGRKRFFLHQDAAHRCTGRCLDSSSIPFRPARMNRTAEAAGNHTRSDMAAHIRIVLHLRPCILSCSPPRSPQAGHGSPCRPRSRLCGIASWSGRANSPP